MKAKQLILLLVAAAVVVAASVLVYRKRAAQWTASEAAGIGAAVLPGLAVNDVAAIAVKDATSSLKVEKKEGVWCVPDAGGYRADYEKVRNLLLTLKDLKLAQTVPGGESALDRLNLHAPEEGQTASGVLLSLLGADGKELAAVVVGKDHLQKSESPNPYMGGNWPNGKFVRVPASGLIGLVTERFYAVTTQASNWLDKEFFKVGEKQFVSLARAGQTVYEFKREKKGDSLLMAALPAGEELDSAKVSSLSGALSYASFDEVAPRDAKPEDTGLGEPQVCRIVDFDGVEYTLNIGKKTDQGKYYLTVGARDVGPAERVKPEGETEEAARTADEEFKKSLEQRQKTVRDIEQKLGGWVYLVSSYTVEPILKEAKDFLKAKEAPKPEAKEGEAAAEDAPEGTAGGDDTPPPPPPPPPPAE